MMDDTPRYDDSKDPFVNIATGLHRIADEINRAAYGKQTGGPGENYVGALEAIAMAIGYRPGLGSSLTDSLDSIDDILRKRMTEGDE